jgi:hypothetical protein
MIGFPRLSRILSTPHLQQTLSCTQQVCNFSLKFFNQHSSRGINTGRRDPDMDMDMVMERTWSNMVMVGEDLSSVYYGTYTYYVAVL